MTVPELLRMSQAELDALFTSSSAGKMPAGEAQGTAIIAPGTTYSEDLARFVRRFGWQGKIFEPGKGVLRNRISPFGWSAVPAAVYKAPSWLDGRECIVLDYSATSLLARRVRDEIRAVSPQIYLGKVYWNRKRLIDFALEFPAADR